MGWFKDAVIFHIFCLSWFSLDICVAARVAMAVPSLQLIYLDHHYWRAECARVALFMAGIPFDDARMDYNGMYSSGALTFGTFPALVVGGKGVLNQTQAIARYVGHLTNMYPSDPFLAAKCDEAIDCLTDISDLVTDTMQERDPKRKIAWRQALVAPDGRMTMLLNGLETLLRQNGAQPVPFVAGNSLTVADLAIWRAVGWISSGVIDGIPTIYVKTQFPNLWQLHCMVDQLPKLAEWKAKNPHHYARRWCDNMWEYNAYMHALRPICTEFSCPSVTIFWAQLTVARVVKGKVHWRSPCWRLKSWRSPNQRNVFLFFVRVDE